MSVKNIAVYCRCSSLTGKEEELRHQQELCLAYVQLNYSEHPVTIFQDDVASERPAFDKMMTEVRKGNYKAVVCASLDRICRSLTEFTDLARELDEYTVTFSTVDEQLSTASPLGRAMLYLASVLEKLERKNASERVRDNMQELARTGRWLGGVTPTGYRSEKRTEKDADGKKQTVYALKIIPAEAQMVRTIYEQFLETGSLTQVERYLQDQGIKTKNNRAFSRFTVRQLLENPVYVKADATTQEYFARLGVDLTSPPEAFDGVHGMMVYNKTVQSSQKGGKPRDRSEWIAAVGQHEGIISGEQWVQAQEILEINKSKVIRKPKSGYALLSGLLRCGNCGAYMRPKPVKKLTSRGDAVFVYLCETKEKTRSQQCQMKNVNGNLLDQAISQEVRRLSADSEVLLTQLERSRQAAASRSDAYKDELEELRQTREGNEKSISSLVFSLVKAIDKTAYDYIIKQIDELHAENAKLDQRLEELTKLTGEHLLSGEEINMVQEILLTLQTSFDDMTVEQKRAALRSLLEKVVWDGQSVQVFLHGAVTEDVDI